MRLLIKHTLNFLIIALSSHYTKAFCQNLPVQPNEITILRDSTFVPAESGLHFIGEVKGRSYIRLKLEPLEADKANTSAYAEQLHYKGSYYEAVNGASYPVSASFTSGTRAWTIKCRNSKRQTIYLFNGREDIDGNIEGVWKSKKQQLPFYLFKK